MIVAPSILSADFSILKEEIESVNHAEFIHIDVMDGHFVPNITIGPLVVKSIKNIDKVKDVHLMISDPKKYALDFINAGADYLTFHYEAVEEDKIIELIDFIHASNCKAGISIKPNTSVKVLDKYLKYLDLVLVMSVEPGFGGQKFIDSAIDKIKYLSDNKRNNNYQYLIEVDGGINKETSVVCKNAGVEVLVAGSYIFKSNKRNDLIDELMK